MSTASPHTADAGTERNNVTDARTPGALRSETYLVLQTHHSQRLGSRLRDIENSPSGVGAAVIHRHLDAAPAVEHRHPHAAAEGQRPVRRSEGAGPEDVSAGGAVAVQPGPVIGGVAFLRLGWLGTHGMGTAAEEDEGKEQPTQEEALATSTGARCRS